MHHVTTSTYLFIIQKIKEIKKKEKKIKSREINKSKIKTK